MDRADREALQRIEAERFAEDLGGVLREIKPDSNITGWQDEIADACLSDRKTVQRWQSGTAAPESWRLRKLFRHLDGLEDRVMDRRQSAEPDTISRAALLGWIEQQGGVT